MDFKKWLLKLEIGDNYGADLPLHRPDKQALDNHKKGVGAFRSVDFTPLPGNKKPMKKKSKKK